MKAAAAKSLVAAPVFAIKQFTTAPSRTALVKIALIIPFV